PLPRSLSAAGFVSHSRRQLFANAAIAPKGATSSSAEENFGFWIDEPTKIVTFADGKKLNVHRFDDHWISAVSGDVSYELDRKNGRTKKELPHRAPKRIFASGLVPEIFVFYCARCKHAETKMQERAV